VQAPALVLHRRGVQITPFAAVQRLATMLPNARFVPLEGTLVDPSLGDSQAVVDAVRPFLAETSGRKKRASKRATAAAAMPRGTAVILFTDIANSTALTERMGDAAFRAASRTLDAAIRAAMREGGGSPVEGKVLGDGVMGVFTSAAQAIDAARRCVELSGESELRLHIGLHAGDVIREESNVYGGAVNIASRVCGLCEPGEILVSGTIRDLARTSAGATFEDRGEHLLKGIDDPVRVFAVRGE
jgi:class 3 adenylate cyclase